MTVLREKIRRGVPAGLVSLFVIVTCAITARDFGLTTDEDIYIESASRIENWFGDFADVGFLENMTSEQRLKSGWYFARPESKNLPLVSLLSVAGYALVGQFDDPLVAYRWGNILLFGLTCGVIFHWVREKYSTAAASVALFALLGNPRLYVNANLLSIDPLIGCFWVLASYALSRSRDNWGWSIWFAILAGVGMTSRPTFWFAFPAWLVWGMMYRPRELWRAGVCVVIVTPLVALLFLPMWWTNPVGGVLDYLEMMQAGNAGWQTGAYYWGEIYQLNGVGAIPWYGVLVLAAITTPVWILCLGLCGVWNWLGHRRRDEVVALWVFSGVILPVVIMLPMTPAHDGVRLFRPAFFFIALWAAAGFESLRKRFWQPTETAQGKFSRGECVVVGLVCGLCLWPHYRMHPHSLSYYNFIVGGFSGATARREMSETLPDRERPRFEISYWYDLLNDDALSSLQEYLPKGAKIWFFPEYGGAKRLQSWGRIRGDIEIVEKPSAADFFVLYGRMSRLLDPKVAPLGKMFLQGKPVWEYRVQDVRAIGLYRRNR
ncbi:MAG: hypothetical protein Tsb009_28570 [Planctomycetaceae bacterium]